MPILFLKATGAPRKYANMPGYVKIKGHWQRANKELKVPAGAPKAAHPEAHAKGKQYHMPEEHAKQLMYPADKAAKNHEMKNFNEKHVPNLLAHAKEGDVTAILGHKYGTNTHAKKLVAIANHLLSEMGSTHTVSLGQQAGAHEAVSQHPKAKGEQPQAEAENAPQNAAGEASEAPAQEEAKEAVSQVADALQEPAAEPSPAEAKKPASALEMPAFMSGKQSKGVRTAYESHAQKIMDAAGANDINALQALVNPNAGAWKGKTANSKMLLALYGQALSKVQQSGTRFKPLADEPNPVAAVETLASTTAQPKATGKADAKVLDAIDWDSYRTPDHIKSSKGYNKQIDAIKAAAYAGDVYGILGMKYGTNTYAKKSVAAANAALTALGHPGLKVITGKDAVHPLLEQLPQPTAEAKEEQATVAEVQKVKDEGPKDGETRMGKNGMQVFHDGRWHNQETDEPVSDKEASSKPKPGQQVTPSQMKELPAGTVVQTYDADGKPSHQFRLGHFSAWFINANGKQLKKPISKGQYLGLVGIDQENYNGYTGGYHNNDHPTTIVKMGDKNWVSDKMKSALKAMYPGAKAMNYPAVYAIHGGQYMLITNSGWKTPGGIIIDEHGEWYGAQALADGYKDPTFAAIMAGETPDAPDLAPVLGLAPNLTDDLPEPNIHPDYGVQGLVNSAKAALADSNFPQADHYIMDAAEKLKALDDGTEDSLKTMQWLVHAKAKAHEGAQAQPAQPIEPVPAPQVEPAKMTPLPDFKNAEEFFAWSKTKEADQWLDEGEQFYGSSDAWNAAPEAQAWDAWAEKHTKEQEAKWAKEQAEKDAQAKKLKEAHAEKFVSNKDAEDLGEVAHDAYNYNKPGMARKAAYHILEKYGYSDDAINTVVTMLGGAGGNELKVLAKTIEKDAKAKQKQMAADAQGPHEGDTRMGKYGLQKLINGHWVNIGASPEMASLKGPELAEFEKKTKLANADSDYHGMLTAAQKFIEGHDYSADAVKFMEKKLKALDWEHVAEFVKDQFENQIADAKSKKLKAAGDKPVMPSHFDATVQSAWKDTLDLIQNGVDNLDMEDLDDAIYATSGMKGKTAQEIHQYALDAKNWLEKKQGQTGAEAKAESSKPVKPDVPKKGIWPDEIDKIEAAIASGDVAALEMAVELTNGLQTEGPKATQAYAKAGIEYLQKRQQAAQVAQADPVTALGIKMAGAKDNFDVMVAVESYVNAQGQSKQSYIDVVKAAGGNAALLNVAKMYMQKSIDLHGMPQGIPKAEYKGSNMGTADSLDGMAAMGMVWMYADDPQMKEAAANAMNESAYALTANPSGEGMYLAKYAVELKLMMMGKAEAEPQPVAPSSLSDDEVNEFVVTVGHITKNVDNGKSLKVTLAANSFLVKHNFSADALQVMADTLKANGWEAKADNILEKAAEDHPQPQTQPAAEEGPKEGDMKPGVDGMLILKDGHWVKAGPDEIAPPDWAALGLTAWQQEYYGKVAENVKNGLASGKLKGVLTQKADGVMLAYHPMTGKCKIHVNMPKAPGKQALAQYISLLVMAHNKKLKADWNPEVTGTYAASALPVEQQTQPAPKPAPKTAANPANNVVGQPIDWDAPVKKYKWQKVKDENIDHWTVTGGNQGGSNEGQKMQDENGQEWYVKYPKDPDQAKSEVLAAKLYGAADMSAQDAKVVIHNGKVAIASKWENLKKAKNAKEIAKAKGMLEGFAMDAWLGNWDVVGLANDNVQLKDDGSIHRVDAGGSLFYRAKGEKKKPGEFGAEVKELETFFDASLNSNSKAVFSHLTEEDINASVMKVLNISDSKIANLVNMYGPGSDDEKSALTKLLIRRKEYLEKKYPDAAAMVMKAKFKPENITPPADFLNWSGPGKSGPSSIQKINEANHAAAQEIYALALDANIEGIQALKAPLLDKATFEPAGEALVVDHISQHISGYAKQAIAEIEHQLEPHDETYIGGENPLFELHSKYRVSAWSGSSADKIGNLLVLGDPGTIEPAEIGLVKQSMKNGLLSTSTYAQAAQSAYGAMPATQQQAVKSYTGGGYSSMNSSLWQGNPNAKAQAAASALMTHGHEIKAGTVLGRKFSLGEAELAKLKKSVGKVLMEPAIMSTSISPDAWSGSVHLKMHAGPGVKGLYVDQGSHPNGGAISLNAGSNEREVVLPPNTRLLIIGVSEGGDGTGDSDGFGKYSKTVVECIILPSE
ncbi:hypothetical protein NAD41_002381 [Salmonella enterica]|nr:hypothetical protein [Salmonella enterica]EKK6596349.1 hypothetical protein [Salmonella enterica]